jgi:hypothetical protein
MQERANKTGKLQNNMPEYFTSQLNSSYKTDNVELQNSTPAYYYQPIKFMLAYTLF